MLVQYQDIELHILHLNMVMVEWCYSLQSLCMIYDSGEAPGYVTIIL